MIEHTAADAVVSVRRDGDGNRRRGRCRIVVGFRGIGIYGTGSCLSESKVLVYNGIAFRGGRSPVHEVIRYGSIFLYAFNGKQRKYLFAYANGSLGYIQCEVLRLLLPRYRKHNLGGYAVIIGSRHTDYGALSGLDILDGQFCFFRKNSAILTVIVPFVGNVGSVIAVRGFCCRGKCYGIARTGS